MNHWIHFFCTNCLHVEMFVHLAGRKLSLIWWASMSSTSIRLCKRVLVYSSSECIHSELWHNKGPPPYPGISAFLADFTTSCCSNSGVGVCWTTFDPCWLTLGFGSAASQQKKKKKVEWLSVRMCQLQLTLEFGHSAAFLIAGSTNRFVTKPAFRNGLSLFLSESVFTASYFLPGWFLTTSKTSMNTPVIFPRHLLTELNAPGGCPNAAG